MLSELDTHNTHKTTTTTTTTTTNVLVSSNFGDNFSKGTHECQESATSGKSHPTAEISR